MEHISMFLFMDLEAPVRLSLPLQLDRDASWDVSKMVSDSRGTHLPGPASLVTIQPKKDLDLRAGVQEIQRACQQSMLRLGREAMSQTGTSSIFSQLVSHPILSVRNAVSPSSIVPSSHCRFPLFA